MKEGNICLQLLGDNFYTHEWRGASSFSLVTINYLFIPCYNCRTSIEQKIFYSVTDSVTTSIVITTDRTFLHIVCLPFYLRDLLYYCKIEITYVSNIIQLFLKIRYDKKSEMIDIRLRIQGSISMFALITMFCSVFTEIPQVVEIAGFSVDGNCGINFYKVSCMYTVWFSTFYAYISDGDKKILS